MASPSQRGPHSLKSTSSSTKIASLAPQRDKPGALSLAQRLLSTTPTTPLPPLFPTPTPELTLLNEQIYRFLALALRAFVLTWWSKLSPRDKEFLPQISTIVRHVVEELHQRLQRADLSELLLINVPTLIRQHYADYRHAQSKVGTSYATTAPSSLPHIFHRLQPHMAIHLDEDDMGGASPTNLVDPTYLAASVDIILKTCLPPEDSGSDMERHIVREIIVGPILGTSLARLTQPWFIYTMMLNALRRAETPAPTPQARPTSRLTFHALAVLFFTAVQAISTFFLKVIQLSQSVIHLANALKPQYGKPITTRWEALSVLFSSNSRDPDSSHGYAGPSLALIREILDLGDHPETNYTAAATLNSLDLVAVLTESFGDQYLPHILQSRVLTPSILSTVITAATSTLFPDSNNGYPLPSPETPSPEEQIAIRERLEALLSQHIPFPFASQGAPARILEPLSSPECNTHLVLLVIDLLLYTLFPEMST